VRPLHNIADTARDLVYSLVLDHLHYTPQIYDTCNSIAMAPSEKVLSDAIRNAVRRMFNGPDRDDLTVNKIRKQVEKELHLDAGFFKEGSWKQESKNIVKTEHVTVPFSFAKLVPRVC
jgi:hypothetical protein